MIVAVCKAYTDFRFEVTTKQLDQWCLHQDLTKALHQGIESATHILQVEGGKPLLS